METRKEHMIWTNDICTCGHEREFHRDGYAACQCIEHFPDDTEKDCECEDFVFSKAGGPDGE